MLLLILNMILNIFANPNSSINKELENYIFSNLVGYDSVAYSFQEDLHTYKLIEINQKRRSNRIGNNFFVPVKFVDQNNFTKEKFLVAKIELYKKVLVCNTIINKGDLIDASNSLYRLANVTEVKQTPFIQNEEQFQVVAKFNLQPGTIVCIEHVEAQPIINVGDKVNLKYIFGGVTVSFLGIARQSGALGDIVKIRANNQQYSAEIINHSEAIIVE